jgi:hypothetical protein
MKYGEEMEFITFEFEKYPYIKLTIPISESQKSGTKVQATDIWADPSFHQLDDFRRGYQGSARWERWLKGNAPCLNWPVPDDVDDFKAPPINFSDKANMNVFREKGNYPEILARRVLYFLNTWKLDNLGINEFLDKYCKE